MPTGLVLMTGMLVFVQANTGDRDGLLVAANDGQAGGDRNAFLGQPGRKIDSIRQILLNTADRVSKDRNEMDRAISEIVANEREIASGKANEGRTQTLIRRNVLLFSELERIRISMADIQFQSARRVFEIEQASRNEIMSDASRRLRQISANPAEYWLWRREHLLKSEMEGTLSGADIARYYKR
jgi:hypothetical protein